MNDLDIIYEEVFGEEEFVTENKIKDTIINLSINKKNYIRNCTGGSYCFIYKKDN